MQAELRRGVDPCIAGTSVFNYDKAIRNICRHGLDWVDVDFVNAAFSILAHELPVEVILPPIVTYNERREDVIAKLTGYLQQKAEADAVERKLSKAPQITRDDVKGLFIRMLFGGTLDGFLRDRSLELIQLDGDIGDFLYLFQDAVKRMHNYIMHTWANEANILRSPERRCKNIRGSLAMHVYCHYERKWLQRLVDAISASGSQPHSFEHDGVGTTGDAAKILAAAAAGVAPLKVTLKPLMSETDPLFGLKLHFPDRDWTITAQGSLSEYYDLIVKCRQYIEEGAPAVKRNNITFSKYVVMQLQGMVHVPAAEGERRTHFELFGARGRWRSLRVEDLVAITADALARLVRPPMYFRWERHAIKDDPPPPLNDSGFFAKLSDQILGRLSQHRDALPLLDGDGSRLKLLFRDGRLYDFDRREVRDAVPADRMSLCTGCDFEVWTPSEKLRAAAEALPGQARQFFVKAATMRSVKKFEDLAEGKVLVMTLESLADEMELLRVLKAFCGNDWNLVVWFLRNVARAAAALARICEFLYLFGPGSSGKDVVMMLVLAFFGEGPSNYGMTLNGSFMIHEGKAIKENASPLLAGTQGKRFIWVSEVPKHKNLQVDLIKQYCEQNGAPIVARKLYKGPVHFRPIGWLASTSNYCASVINPDDDGFNRRIRLWQTSVIWKAKPDPMKPTEKKADPLIKDRILKGEFNPQMLFMIIALYDTLDHEANPSTNVEPMPPSMQELQIEMQEGNSNDRLKEFLSLCSTVDSRNDGCPMKLFKATLAKYLGIKKSALGPVLTAAGIDKDGPVNSHGVRVVLVKWPEHSELHPPVPIVLPEAKVLEEKMKMKKAGKQM